MILGQILVSFITTISNMDLAQWWRLETRSRTFYDSNKMTVWQDLLIFSSWYLLFLIFHFTPFQKAETLETWHNWLLSNWGRLLNWKGLEISISSPNLSKDFRKILPLLISINWPSLVGKWVVVQKIYSCNNTRHDVTGLGWLKI